MTSLDCSDNASEAPSSDPPRLEIRNLCKIYGRQANKRALPLLRKGVSAKEIQQRTGCTLAANDVSFEVRPHETFVLMGLSGCGKSTVLRCLNRLIEPTAGDISVDGDNIMGLGPSALRALRREKMSMVFQNFGLLPHRTVLENAGFGLEIQHLGTDQRKRQALEALELVGLDDYADRPVQALSGGMQQRVGLARALAAGTGILLMDEAFSALDPLIRAEMQDELIALQDKMQKTIVFITHDLDEALKLGDRIAIMKEGGIVQVGTPEEILTQPRDEYVRSFLENVDRSRVLTAETIMRQPVKTVRLNTKAQMVLRSMRELSLPTLFVVDQHQCLVGAVHVDALVEHIRSGGSDLEPVVRRDVPTTLPETPIEELLPIASQEHEPIPVVDENRQLRGLVTRTAILASMAGNRQPPAQQESHGHS